MKRALSITIALIMAASMAAMFALVPVSVPGDPFRLLGVKVSDVSGYVAPYLAIDNANPYIENQVAYVVVSMELRATDGVDYGALDWGQYHSPGTYPMSREISITSTTLDLSLALSTDRYQIVSPIGTIYPVTAAGYHTTPWGTSMEYDVTLNKVSVKPLLHNWYDIQPQLGGLTSSKTIKLFYTFAAITKPATVGEVKASLTVAPVKFALFNGDDKIPCLAGSKRLDVYGTDGALKYIIIDNGGNEFSFWVLDANKKLLVAYNNTAPGASTGAKFDKLYTLKTPGLYAGGWAEVTPNYLGRLIYVDYIGASVDITDTVNAINAFFGFSFQYTQYPVREKHFEVKTAGNPIVVSDTYAYVTAVVTESDDNIDIAPTGDLSANIIVVMAASAVLAAAALAFVAKRSRE